MNIFIIYTYSTWQNFTNITKSDDVDPDELANKEPTHLDLHLLCTQNGVWGRGVNHI